MFTSWHQRIKINIDDYNRLVQCEESLSVIQLIEINLLIVINDKSFFGFFCLFFFINLNHLLYDLIVSLL